MQSGTKLQKLIASKMIEDGMVEGSPVFFIGIIREALATDPTLVEELAPGMKLVKRRQTRKERAVTSIPMMNAVKEAYRKEMLAAIVPVIHNVRRLRPTANGHEIAHALNETNYGPAKNRKEWTYLDVRRLLRRLKIELEPIAL